MHSPSDSRPRAAANLFRIWNRKIHFYLGLYFLFFTWLFAFTGLLLNHSWKFAEFYPNRKVTTTEHRIHISSAGSDRAAVATEVIRQLMINGEIAMGAPSGPPEKIDFTVSRPGRVFQVQADLKEGHARVTANQYNVWGVMHVLHTFTGVSATDPSQRRDWALTTVWAFAMDAVAFGLIMMMLSSYYMWWVLTQKRMMGSIVLLAGCVSCFLFVFGLRWIYS